MPFVSEEQRKAMGAALHGQSKLGIPKDVAEKFFAHDMAPVLTPNSAIPAGIRRLARDAVEGLELTPEEYDELLGGLSKFFAQDEEPKTLYVHRKLTNADEILQWARDQGFKTTLPPDDMHTTVAFSKAPIVWKPLADGGGDLTQDAGPDGRSLEALGDKGAVVLRFESEALGKRWQEFRDQGASWDHDGYRPHVTITYDGAGIDLDKIQPYAGELKFGPEVFQEVDQDWADKVKKRHIASDAKITINVDDEDGQLKKLLEYIKANSEVGHSFGVVVDPDDRELAKKFYIDGDGAFRIRDITMAMDRNVIDRTFKPPADSRFEIAMDRDSVREKTRDGRLIVKRTHISKANVCPYRGKEIPGWEALGLDPEHVYNLLRDPDELAKAAPTLNGVQLLIKHIPVNADDHRPNETVGSLGSDAEFDGEYLDNSLYVNSKEGIDAIESGRQRELSAGYHYKPDMTAGNFRGTAYDGVMRDIVFNHVALVEDGRAGPDVVVGDEALKENDMAKATRFGARTLNMTAASIAPLLAMDSKVTLPKDLFIPLTTKNFKDHRAKLMSGVKLALDGKLKKGIALDSSIEKFGKALDAFIDDVNSGMDEPAPEDKMDEMSSVEPPKGITEPGSTYDAEPMKAYMKQCGMDDEMIGKCMDMMPKNGLAGDSEETPEEKKKREEAADKAAKDADMDKDKVSKPAMDAALKAQAENFQKELKTVRETERGVRAAIAEVHPWTGDLPATMAFDTAADVFRHALTMRGRTDAKTLHADALLPILQTLPKNGARQQNGDAPVKIAMDAVEKANKIAPGLEHISTSL